jgi:hypothetical protein
MKAKEICQQGNDLGTIKIHEFRKLMANPNILEEVANHILKKLEPVKHQTGGKIMP